MEKPKQKKKEADLVPAPAPKPEETVDTGVTDADKQLDIDRDNRTLPVMKLAFKMIAECKDLKVGSQKVDTKEIMEVYVPMVEQLISEMLKNDVRMSEIKWVFDLMNAVITNVTQITERSMDKSSKAATATLFGCDDFDDIQVSDVDKVLKAKK